MPHPICYVGRTPFRRIHNFAKMRQPVTSGDEFFPNYLTMYWNRRTRYYRQSRSKNDHFAFGSFDEFNLPHKCWVTPRRIVPRDGVAIHNSVERILGLSRDHKEAIRQVRYHSVSSDDVPSSLQRE